MLAMVQRRPRRYPTRLYLFEDGRPTARIPVSVFKQMLAGVSFKRFAGTSQSILEVTFDPAGVPKKIAGSIYRFDDNGVLDLGAIVAGVGYLGKDTVKSRRVPFLIFQEYWGTEMATGICGRQPLKPCLR